MSDINDLLAAKLQAFGVGKWFLLILLPYVFVMICLYAFRFMVRSSCKEQANLSRKMWMLGTAVRNATGMDLYSIYTPDWDNGYLAPCKFERDNGDIVPGAVKADGKGRLRVYERTGDSYWESDSGFRFLGEAEYQEIWKKPSRRRF